MSVHTLALAHSADGQHLSHVAASINSQDAKARAIPCGAVTTDHVLMQRRACAVT